MATQERGMVLQGAMAYACRWRLTLPERTFTGSFPMISAERTIPF